MLLAYAILDRPPRRPLRGLARAPIRTLSAGRLHIAYSELATAPAITPPNLRAYDAALRRLAQHASAILPTRFPTTFPSERALRAQVTTLQPHLAQGLTLVKHREQMTLRLWGQAPPSNPAPHQPNSDLPREWPQKPRWPSSGAAYLRAARRRTSVPELDPIRTALASTIHAERVERAAAPPLVATAYHLITRGHARAYRATVRRAASAADLRVRVTGPFPPYAFAPEVAS